MAKSGERPMGEQDHAAWQKAILLWFAKHEREWNVEALPEYRVQVSLTRFRVPDVSVIDFASPSQLVATSPPMAVSEVLSPEDTVIRVRRKLEDYAKTGISQIWVIDPEDGVSLRYLNGELLRGEVFEEPSWGNFVSDRGDWESGSAVGGTRRFQGERRCQNRDLGRPAPGSARLSNISLRAKWNKQSAMETSGCGFIHFLPARLPSPRPSLY